ncbi:MAG: glycosyltransferase [Candidatus Tectomicrobia bacterium]|nr:glycosyltransferase [Candidatus Tectomicrobia bacterium]
MPQIARWQRKAGLDVRLAALYGSSSEAVGPASASREPVWEVPYHFFRCRGPEEYGWSWGLTAWLWRNAREVDLLHLHGLFSYPTLLGSRLARYFHRPYIVSPHGMLDPWALAWKAWKKRPYFKLFDHRTLKRAAALHALTAAEGRQFAALGLQRPTFVLPNGIDPDDYRSVPPRAVLDARYPELRGKRYLLFLGRLHPKKGLDVLLEAFGMLVRRVAGCSDLLLVLAGPDNVGYRAALELAVARYELSQHVRFTGLLEGEEKLSALGAAELFVLPSHSEGFSMAALEAAACGCPVVLSPACNFPEIEAAGGGVIVEPRGEALARALGALLTDPVRRRDMGRRGQALVREKLNWESIAARMIAVYEDILRGDRLAPAWINGH